MVVKGVLWESGKILSPFLHWLRGLLISSAAGGLIITPHGLACLEGWMPVWYLEQPRVSAVWVFVGCKH